MSQENVEVIRSGLGSFMSGEVEAALSIFDADVEWHTAADEPDTQVYRGHDGVRRLVEAWGDLWEAGFEATAEPQEFIDAGAQVIVPVLAHTRGRGSGVEVEIEETYLFTFSGDKVIRVHEFRTKQEALEAAELAE
jgi:ketosteroid isomerase-like protein